MQQSSLYRRLLSTVRAAVIATQLDGTIIFWNAFATELYGWQQEDVIGRNIMEITVPEQASVQAAAIMISLSSGNSWVGEFTVRCKNGTRRAASVANSPIFGDNDELVGIVGVSFDLTASKHAEEELRRSEQQFRSLANALPEMCWMARADGYVFWYNLRWHEFTGTTPAQIEGWGWQSVHDPDILPAVMKRWTNSIRTGEPFEMEFPLRGHDGVFRWFLTRVQPFRNGEGQIVSWFGVNTNIDKEFKTRLALNEAHQQLELHVQERTAELYAANESLRSLSGRLMQLRDEERRHLARDLHDSLGQSIAAIGMNLGALRRQSASLNPAGVRAVEEIAKMVDDMSRETRTISHLLHPPMLDEVGLVSALRWYVDEYSQRSGINVDLDISESFGRLSDDLEIAVFRIVQECLTNIHRHSGSPTAAIRISQPNRHLIVQIEDRGRGISPEKLAELNSSSLSGVGFRGMRERVGHLRGTWDVRSDEHGTIVSATLPVTKSLSATASSKSL
jgi:PAS domain S-box-containing protein